MLFSKKVLPVFLLLFFNHLANAQSNYQLVYQSSLSTHMGVEIMNTTNFMFGEVEKKYLPPKLFKHPNKKIRNRIFNSTYRLAKTMSIDTAKDIFLKTFQHEVFGHGARLREMGYTRNKYYIGFPFGGGSASFGEAQEGRIVTQEEQIMFRIGGVQSNMLLSNRIRNNWLESGQITLNEAYLYYQSFKNIRSYIRNTDVENATAVNDMYNFYNRINRLNDANLEDTPFTFDYLQKRAIINYINPLQYYALFALIKDYIILGKEEAHLPMINIADYKYLPMIRMGLSPFGTEVYIENFIKSERSLNTLYVRIGDGIFHDFYGMGIKKTNIIQHQKIKLDAELDVWKQPDMELGGEEITLKKEGIGWAAKLGLGIKLFEEPNTSYLFGLFGYKSAGHLEGEYLRGGFFSRIGVMLVN